MFLLGKTLDQERLAGDHRQIDKERVRPDMDRPQVAKMVANVQKFPQHREGREQWGKPFWWTEDVEDRRTIYSKVKKVFDNGEKKRKTSRRNCEKALKKKIELSKRRGCRAKCGENNSS